MQSPEPEETAPSEEPAADPAAVQGVSVDIHPPHGPIRSWKDFLLQLVTITAGVLIALSLEGVREWSHYRTLVREARETLAREIAENMKEVNIATR